MNRSTDRILTTHVGSLVRPLNILLWMKAKTLERPIDEAQFEADVRQSIIEVVRQQADIGIDVPSNGEFGRHGFRGYVNERLRGVVLREYHTDENAWQYGGGGERRVFPEFFEQYYQHYRFLWMPSEVHLEDLPNVPGNYQRYRVVGEVSYAGEDAIARELETLKTAVSGLPFADVFMPAEVPTSRIDDENLLEFYPSQEAYLYAVADALHDEYKAITDAGFLVQLDLAALNPRRAPSRTSPAGAILGQQEAEQRVEVLNHALRGIPEDRVRYHHCWGSMNSPHTQDTPLRELLPMMLKINAQAYVIEAANPRHEHEWMVWQDVKLPDGKILVPGVISHQTNVVEHPELVAWRIKNFASVVGKENVIAGVDCGFSQFWDSMRVHPTVQWAKLKSLVDGAALASQDLWRN